MMGDTGDHMIDRAVYLAKPFVTSNTKDRLVLSADWVQRPLEREIQELLEISKALTLGIIRYAYDGHRARMEEYIEGMVAHIL
jgi:hypothetical protein